MEWETKTQEGVYKETGSYIVHVEGKGNYKGSRDITFTIGEKNVSKLSVSKITQQEYTGKAIEPKVTVKDGKDILEQGVHYKVTYKNNENAGTASVIIKGISPAYVGTKTVTFKITGVSINKVKIEGIPKSVSYSGEEHRPALTLTHNEIPLEENVHYSIDYSKNKDKGKATVIITGKGGYSGTVKKTFTITSFDVTKDTEGQITVQEGISICYAKGGAKPEPEVRFNGTLLTPRSDYTLSYRNHTAITTKETKQKPSVTVKFKGNFKGSIKKEFTILPQNLALLQISGVDIVKNTKANKWQSKVSIVDLDGKALKAGKDYEKALTYYLDEACTIPAKAEHYDEGTVIWVKITGKGNYAGSEAVTSYRIVEKTIAKAKVKIKDQVYTGKAICIDAENIEYVKVNGKTLTLGEHYEIVPESYKNNIQKGTATVQLKGIGEYGGVFNAKFKVKQKALQWSDFLKLLGIDF